MFPMKADELTKKFVEFGVYIPRFHIMFFDALKNIAYSDKLNAIRVLRGMNIIKNLSAERNAIEFLMETELDVTVDC